MLQVPEAVYCILQACEALAEAHASRIVHRDLKPANLFLAKQPGGQVVLKVLDFGISKEINSKSHALTQTAAVMGTPYYMSPEQMRSSKNVDERSDVWALGVILYELVTGRLPFLADSLTEVVALILQNEPDDVRTLEPNLPEGVARAIELCLRTNRDERVSDVGELATMLAPYTDAGEAYDLARRAVSILENTPHDEAAPRSSLVQASRPRKPTSGTLAPIVASADSTQEDKAQPSRARVSGRMPVAAGGLALTASVVFVLVKLSRGSAASSEQAAIAPPPPPAVLSATSAIDMVPQLPVAPLLLALDASAPMPRAAAVATVKPPVKAAAVPPVVSVPTESAPAKPSGGLKGAGGVP